MQSEARRFIVKRSIPEARPTHRSGLTRRQTGPPVPALECRRPRTGGTGGGERRGTASPTAPTTPKTTATGPRPPPRRPRQRRNNATLRPTRQRNYFPARGRRGRRQRDLPNHSIHVPEGRHQRGLATAKTPVWLLTSSYRNSCSSIYCTQELCGNLSDGEEGGVTGLVTERPEPPKCGNSQEVRSFEPECIRGSKRLHFG
jgi:hypothetical protein